VQRVEVWTKGRSILSWILLGSVGAVFPGGHARAGHDAGGAGGGSGDRDYMGDETIHVDIHASRARTWNATPQFIAAMNRGLSSRGTA